MWALSAALIVVNVFVWGYLALEHTALGGRVYLWWTNRRDRMRRGW